MLTPLIAFYAVTSVPGAEAASPSVPVLTPCGDPTSVMCVTWRTPGAKSEPVVWNLPGGEFKSVTPKSQTVKLPNGKTWTYHTAKWSGLEAGKTFAYRIPGRDWLTFRTVPKSGPLKFLYFGDVQSEIGRTWPPLAALAMKTCPDAAFMVFAGDLIDSAHDDGEWQQFFSPGGKFFGTIPSVATPGNHEYRKIGGSGAPLSKQWRPQFEYPLNGPKDLEEQAYVLDYPGMRIVSANSNRLIKDQTPWLDKVLTVDPAVWSFVTYHHPVYSSAQGRDNPAVRSNWDPVFRKRNVAIAFQGHDHTYARVVSAKGSGAGQTVYLTSVAGTKMYPLKPEMKGKAAVSKAKTRTFQVVSIDGDTLKYTAYGLDGKVFDSMTLQKSADGSVRSVGP